MQQGTGISLAPTSLLCYTGPSHNVQGALNHKKDPEHRTHWTLPLATLIENHLVLVVLCMCMCLQACSQ